MEEALNLSTKVQQHVVIITRWADADDMRMLGEWFSMGKSSATDQRLKITTRSVYYTLSTRYFNKFPPFNSV